MIYKISNKKEEVHKILDENLYFGILTLEELERDFKKFGIEYSSIERCKDMNYFSLKKNSTNNLFILAKTKNLIFLFIK